ncbi:hypothetical protein TNCV_329301 [Trichonephila clavipes]|nr:hypothetical protein TNCV_329301 [Trichonephila clavipes]
MILCVAELLERSKKVKNNRCCQGVRQRSRALFHGCGVLKLLEYVVDGTGEVVLEVRRLRRRQTYRPISKKKQAHHRSSRWHDRLLPQESEISQTVARRLRGEGLYARRHVVCVALIRQHRTARLQWCREHLVGLNRTGHAYYSQMRVGSVCHQL